MNTLRAALAELGVSDEELARAQHDGTLVLLAVERLVLPRRPLYTLDALAERSHLSSDQVAQFWRALGFPDTEPDELAFTDDDVAMLAVLSELIAAGIIDPELAVQMTRVIGSSIARIALSQVEAFGMDEGAGESEESEGADAAAGEVGDPDDESDAGADHPNPTHGSPSEGDEIGPHRLAHAAAQEGVLDDPVFVEQTAAVLELMPRAMEYVWRRHVQAAARSMGLRARAGEVGDVAQAVGFADLVGFTALSQQLDSHELAAVVDRFESLAYDVVTRLGGRVVKMIGDEVMFTAPEPAAGAEIALTLSAAYRDDDELSEVRVGLAYGSVLVKEGDCYGPVVNLASRIVGIAFPGTVVVSDAVHEALVADETFVWQSLHRRQLTDIGRVPLWTVRWASDGFGPRSSRERDRAARTERVERAVERRAERQERAAERRADRVERAAERRSRGEE